MVHLENFTDGAQASKSKGTMSEGVRRCNEKGVQWKEKKTNIGDSNDKRTEMLVREPQRDLVNISSRSHGAVE